MSKQVATHGKQNIAPGFTRARSNLIERRSTLGPHLCVQREAAGPAVHPSAPALVRDVVESPGQPLDAATRSFMEPRFGYDLSRVRIHTDERAAESARAVGARAYTAGTHVAFGAGQYAPATPSGQRLMAHELTHIAQQASGPVSATVVADGLALSHPSDRFERSARVASSQAIAQTTAAEAASTRYPLLSMGLAGAGTAFVQCQGDDAARQTAAAESSAKSASTSATAGVYSAIFGGVSALAATVSAFEAIRQANFAERQAQAAEDPPVAEPTTGGVTSTHNELPEVKGVKQSEESSTTKEDIVSLEGATGGEEMSKEEKTAVGKGATVAKKAVSKGPTTTETKRLTEKTVIKPADEPDKEHEFDVLRLAEGADNTADFLLTLRYNNTDVRGGTTEDGEINGYFGGTNSSNAAVTFKGSPGKHLADGTATVRLLFGGTNVPPRKRIGLSTGFLGLGKGGTETNKDYVVQRFAGSARFSGKGELVEVVPPRVSPRDRSLVKTGDGKPGNPLVSISLNAPTAAPAPQPAPPVPAPSKGAPPPISPGGPK